MLPSERAREKRKAELDATSTPWSSTIDRQARVRLATVARKLELNPWPIIDAIAERVGTRMTDNAVFAFDYSAGDAVLLDVIAAIPEVLGPLGYPTGEWVDSVNQIFQQHRIGYKFVDDELIPFEDDELMRNVIEPTLGLLVGEKFQAARRSYREALEEIADGHPADAMTDAGRALEETLEALGCEGDMLGPLVKDAKRKGLLGGVDSPLIDGIERFCNWAAGSRNQMSDAHKSPQARLEDGWLMIHVVGALIQRLAAGTPRQAQPEGQDR